MEPVTVHCARCGHRFEAPGRLAGSIQNCPSCGGATDIPGSFDPTWTALRALAAVASISVAAIVWGASGPLAGAGALAVCACLALLVRLSL